MRLAIAADHAGFALKEALKKQLAHHGHRVEDLGAFDDQAADDYPDFAEKMAQALKDGRADRGILVCGSGVGVSVAANKIPGVRAGVCHDTYSAHQAVEHDDLNVLCLGSRVVGEALAFELVEAFAHARFTGEERHQRRLAKVMALEVKYSR